MPRKQTPNQAKKAALESDYAALYAVAGLTDALGDALRSALAETQERANRRVTDLQTKRSERTKQARHNADEVREFVITLPEQFKQLPDATKARIADLQKQANDLVVQATATYAELAGRGKRAVDEAEKRAEVVLSDVAERVDPAFEKVQEGVTVARRTVTGRSATTSTTPRSAAKATAARQASAAEAAAKREAATKKAAATRAAKKAAAEPTTSTPAQKTPTAKATAKKAPAAKKAPVKRTPAKKTPAAAVTETPVAAAVPDAPTESKPTAE